MAQIYSYSRLLLDCNKKGVTIKKNHLDKKLIEKIGLGLQGATHIPTDDLKQELTQRQEELKSFLPVRIHVILEEIKNEDLAEKEEISPFDLIIRTILKANKEPANCISNLLILANPESNCELMDEWTVSNSAAFISDYLKKDYVLYSLERERKDEK